MTTPIDPGPTTSARVARMLSIELDGDDEVADPIVRARLDDVVAAVNASLTWIEPDADGHWRPDHVHGATMLAARIDRRRHSPSGVETFGGDAATYVQRTDPDVAQLLGLGRMARPAVG